MCGVKRSDCGSTDHVLKVAVGHLDAFRNVSTPGVNRFLSKQRSCESAVDSIA